LNDPVALRQPPLVHY